MTPKLSIFKTAILAVLPLTAICSCTENEGEGPKGGSAEGGKFVFATTVTISSKSACVLVTSDSLESDTITTVNNGTTTESATQWVFLNNYLYGLQYQQGNNGLTRSFALRNDGTIEPRSKEYSINRFSSYGTYNDNILTMQTTEGPEALADSHGYRPMTLEVTYLDVNNQGKQENNTQSGLYSMENFLGNGEYVTLSGAEQSGSKLYCGVVPMGLSQYGVVAENGKWIRPGREHLVHKESGGTGGGSYKANTLVGTQYPDSCWVAIYDNDKMENPKLALTDKISSPCGRFRSQYYQTIWADSKGDVYVFSSSYAKTMTDSLQRTKLNAGVCRIPAGTDKFDDYYCDIEALTPGGNRTFMRCWHAGASSFLMVMYNAELTGGTQQATDLALFNATNKTLTYVTGLPENVKSIGKTVYTSNNKVYIPVNVENEYPAIYSIDINTAKATRGVTIKADDITGFGFMKPTVF